MLITSGSSTYASCNYCCQPRGCGYSDSCYSCYCIVPCIALATLAVVGTVAALLANTSKSRKAHAHAHD